MMQSLPVLKTIKFLELVKGTISCPLPIILMERIKSTQPKIWRLDHKWPTGHLMDYWLSLLFVRPNVIGVSTAHGAWTAIRQAFGAFSCTRFFNFIFNSKNLYNKWLNSLFFSPRRWIYCWWTSFRWSATLVRESKCNYLS